MPELPEVETTRRGIEPHVLHQRVKQVNIRQPRLRWPVSQEVGARLPGCRIESVERRGKYLIMNSGAGYLLIHLGMSGSLRLMPAEAAAAAHDHLDIVLESGMMLRYTDPRRFGCVLWSESDPLQHPLLRSLGPEPLSDAFTGHYLRDRAAGRKLAVKLFIMDSKVVVGVGNIYANEALFMAGIDPRRMAGRISLKRYESLVACIREVLARAIEQGGTTLRDFVGGTGKPGYFSQQLTVYGRGGQACLRCEQTLREIRLGQRSTVYCAHCQS